MLQREYEKQIGKKEALMLSHTSLVQSDGYLLSSNAFEAGVGTSPFPAKVEAGLALVSLISYRAIIRVLRNRNRRARGQMQDLLSLPCPSWC